MVGPGIDFFLNDSDMYIELRTTALSVEVSLLQNTFGAVLNGYVVKKSFMSYGLGNMSTAEMYRLNWERRMRSISLPHDPITTMS